MVKKETYDAKDIDIFKGLEGVRKRPEMYISNTDKNGIFHILKELIDNSVDESIAGYNSTIGVHLEEDGTTLVYDKGRGIPVEKHDKTKISTLTSIFTTLHSGGKMRDGKGSYGASVGTHGVGSSVTNALSEFFTVYTFRNNKWWYQSFKKGVPKTGVEKTNKPTVPNKKVTLNKGTVIKYRPDKKCFEKNAKLDKEKVKDFLKTLSYLHSKTKFVYSTDKDYKEFYQPKGLTSYIDYILENDKKVEKVGKPFVYQDNSVDVVLQWTTKSEETLHSFVNGSMTKEHGTHVQGLGQALVKGIENYKTKRSDYRGEDLRNGLVGAINIKIASPKFDSQTKNKLVTKEAYQDMFKLLQPRLKQFFDNNKTLARKIVRRANEIRNAHKKLQNDKKAASEIKSEKNGKDLLPSGKLTKSKTNNPKERELFLVEGDSAGGTAKKARDPNNQEILALRGKIINAYKDKGKLFQNQEIVDILKSIGYNPSLKDPTNKLRVGKIILLSDADPDGQHINLLLLSLLHKLMPEVFDKKMVYVVDSMLYTYQKGQKRLFGNSVSDLKKQDKYIKTEYITRIKGWGEINQDVLKDIAFDRNKRKLLRIKNIDEKNKFVSIVGEDVSIRKELLDIS